MGEDAEETLSENNEVDAWLVSCKAEGGSITGTEFEKAKVCVMCLKRGSGPLEQRGSRPERSVAGYQVDGIGDDAFSYAYAN